MIFCDLVCRSIVKLYPNPLIAFITLEAETKRDAIEE
jgi:hypothetical protein